MTSITTTMKLNHASFPSSDVSATASFFEAHLAVLLRCEARAGC